jgi:hypothetical protein
VGKPAVESFCLAPLVHLLAMLAFFSLPASAFTQVPAFDVTISSPDSVVTVGSPVRVGITIVNHSDRILLFRSSGCGPAAAGVILRDNQQNQIQPFEDWRESPDKRPCNIGGGTGPHEKTEEVIDLARWFDLSRAGQYSVQLTKTCAGTAETREARTSNILEFEIKERKAK